LAFAGALAFLPDLLFAAGLAFASGFAFFDFAVFDFAVFDFAVLGRGFVFLEVLRVLEILRADLAFLDGDMAVCLSCVRAISLGAETFAIQAARPGGKTNVRQDTQPPGR
jgi:hypothetical protein